MPTPNLPALGDNPSQRQILDYIVKLQRDLEWLLGNLDSLNVRKLTADVIDTGTLNADLVTIRSDLTSGYIQINGSGMVVNNGSYNTFSVDANGNVVLTSALIRSSTGYPYVELSPTGNYFGAFQTANQYARIAAVEGLSNTPALIFRDTGLSHTGLVYIDPAFNELNIGTTKSIRFSLGPSGYVRIDGTLKLNDFDDLYSIGDAQSLQEALDNLSSSIAGLSASLAGKATAGASTANSSILNSGIAIGTRLAVWGTGDTVSGYVTWNGVSAHSHIQT